jgi:hypothetical protein
MAFKMKRKGFPMKSPVKHTYDGGTWETSKSRDKWGKHDMKYGEGHETHETPASITDLNPNQLQAVEKLLEEKRGAKAVSGVGKGLTKTYKTVKKPKK